MRPSERLELIESIGKELQARYTFDDVDMYLSAFGIASEPNTYRGSKRVYAKHALQYCDERVLMQIAADLHLVPKLDVDNLHLLPKNWIGIPDRKVFLSHLSKSKENAARLKLCLQPYGINLFVAHEDIHPTLEWQREILRALRSMDCFISLHTPGFLSSFWCQQEVGYALAREVPCIAIRMGEDSVGFQGAKQALSRGRKTAEEISLEIADIWGLTQLTQTQ